jgi:HD-GYP domain-containing protein (c-di-GMP phosphodiesterase class II)
LLPRIIAVADTFDALTTNRPYQKAHDCHEALRIIHSLSGKRLDQDAVAALNAVFQRGEIQVPHAVAMAAGASNEAAPASMVFPPANDAIEMDRV